MYKRRKLPPVSYYLTLPPELLYIILQFLDIPTLIQLFSTSHFFRSKEQLLYPIIYALGYSPSIPYLISLKYTSFLHLPIPNITLYILIKATGSSIIKFDCPFSYKDVKEGIYIQILATLINLYGSAPLDLLAYLHCLKKLERGAVKFSAMSLEEKCYYYIHCYELYRELKGAAKQALTKQKLSGLHVMRLLLKKQKQLILDCKNYAATVPNNEMLKPILKFSKLSKDSNK